MIKIVTLQVAVREYGRDIPQEEYSEKLMAAMRDVGVGVIDGTLNVFNVNKLTKQ